MRNFKELPLLLLCLMRPEASHALGLGEMQIHSQLNEPLRASVSLLLDSTERLQDVRIPQSGTALPGQRTGRIVPLKFAIRASSSTAVIDVSTLRPFKSRAIDFDLTAELGSLLITRSYHAPMPGPHANPALLQGDSYGPVRPSDTLWSIAELMRVGTAFTQDQMLLGLIETNKDHLDAHHLHLKPGQYLRFPTAEVLEGLGEKKIRQEAARAAFSSLEKEKPQKVSRDTLQSPSAPPLPIEAPEPPIATPPTVAVGETAEAHEETDEIMIEHPENKTGEIITQTEIPFPSPPDLTIDQPFISIDGDTLLISLVALFCAFCAGLLTGGMATYLLTRPGRREKSKGLPVADQSTPQLNLDKTSVDHSASDHANSIDDILETISDLKAKDKLVLKPEISGSQGAKSRAKTSGDGLQDLTDNDLMETRLDLAKSYLGMGEWRQARNMLGSVLNKGNELQIREAIQLMERLESQQDGTQA